MYDNIDISVKKEQFAAIDFLKDTPQYLSSVLTMGESQFGEYITGYLGKYKVKITDRAVKVYDNSICKGFLGDNFKTLTRMDTKRAIEQISNNLHLPFDKGIVTRIDFAQNLIMQHPESVYYHHLGALQYYDRLPQNNGVYYSNKKRQLVFYGKVYEQKLKHQPIPELYSQRNVLRYEMRFKKNLPKQFNRFEIIGSTLYEEGFYYDLVARWRDEYLKIQKIESKISNMKPTGSTKEIGDYALRVLIEEIGQEAFFNTVKEWQSTGAITKKQASDHRKKIKLLSKEKLNSDKNEIIVELDKKIKEAAR